MTISYLFRENEEKHEHSENCSSLLQDFNRILPDHETEWLQMFTVLNVATNWMSKILTVMLRPYMAWCISGLWTTILLCTFYRKIVSRKCNGQFYPSGMIFNLNTTTPKLTVVMSSLINSDSDCFFHFYKHFPLHCYLSYERQKKNCGQVIRDAYNIQ